MERLTVAVGLLGSRDSTAAALEQVLGEVMQQAMDLVLSVGKFAMLVIVVCVGVMLLISFVDRDRRPDSARRNKDRNENE